MTEPVMETRGLTKSFGALRATYDVSITLRPGEIHAIIGPNGAGKSTLIGQIGGALTPDAGQVWLGGRDVTALPVQARARAGLARTFQISQLAMEDTVLQNVLLGALGATGQPWRMLRPVLGDHDLRARAEAALERVGLLCAGQHLDEAHVDVVRLVLQRAAGVLGRLAGQLLGVELAGRLGDDRAVPPPK